MSFQTRQRVDRFYYAKANLIGQEEADKLEIIANDVHIKEDGKFEIVFKHPESHYGHDKSKALRPYAHLPADERPTIFFCGDGVSDMSAFVPLLFKELHKFSCESSSAGESDLLFVKLKDAGANDLADHCKQKNIPYVPFHRFEEVCLCFNNCSGSCSMNRRLLSM